jgi:hypothetical protein
MRSHVDRGGRTVEIGSPDEGVEAVHETARLHRQDHREQRISPGIRLGPAITTTSKAPGGASNPGGLKEEEMRATPVPLRAEAAVLQTGLSSRTVADHVSPGGVPMERGQPFRSFAAEGRSPPAFPGVERTIVFSQGPLSHGSPAAVTWYTRSQARPEHV